MAELVQAVPEMTSQMARMVLPARGSVGRKLELQADTLAAKLAEKLLSDYRMLHLPDNLSAHVLEEMKQDPEVAETIEEMKQADILLLGVGNALEMAERRRLDAGICGQLQRDGAVAEACGYRTPIILMQKGILFMKRVLLALTSMRFKMLNASL